MELWTNSLRPVRFLIDEENYELVSWYPWYLMGRYIGTPIKRSTLYLHIHLFGMAKIGFEWDHIDRNKCNNQRANLRQVDHSTNMLNTDLQTNNTSGIRGVGWRRDKQQWQAQINIGRRVVHLGCYDTIEEAKIGRAHV